METPLPKRHIRERGFRVPVQSGESIPSAEVVEGVFLYIQHRQDTLFTLALELDKLAHHGVGCCDYLGVRLETTLGCDHAYELNRKVHVGHFKRV